MTWFVAHTQKKSVVVRAASLGHSALEGGRKVTWAEGMWRMSPCVGHLVSCGALWWAERGLQARWGASPEVGGGLGECRQLRRSFGSEGPHFPSLENIFIRIIVAAL